MNREIKFRGVKITDNKFIYGQLRYGIGKDKYLTFIFNENSLAQIVKNSECEFTGLKDKNGKEIYEGDIIDEKYKYRVEYKDGSFYCNSYLLFDFLKIRKNAKCESEIIGNIFENPELLK